MGLHWLASAAAASNRGSTKALVLVATAAAAAAALTSPPPLSPAPTKTLLFPARRHSTAAGQHHQDPQMAPSAANPALPPPPTTSPWVILGSIPRVAELEGGADMSLALAAPPRVSRLSISARVFPARTTPQNFPIVLAGDPSGLLLLSAILDAPLTRIEGHQSLCWRDSDPRYFVLDATTGSALRLPDPAPQEPVLDQALLGVVACPGGGGRYAVAELVPVIGSDTASLRVYYTDVGEWVEKQVRYPLPPRLLAPARTIALYGRLWWTDYSWGVITADPFADHPVLSFVPLPRPCVLQSREAWGVLDQFRYVGVSAGNLHFVDTYRRGGAPNKVTVWMLPHKHATEWVLEHEATFADIWANDTYKATGLPKKPPSSRSSTPTTPPSSTFSWRTTSSPSTCPPARWSTASATTSWRLPVSTLPPWELPRAVSSVLANWSGDIGPSEPTEA